jgi:hypothetical protein
LLNAKLDFSHESAQHAVIHTALDALSIDLCAAQVDAAKFDPKALKASMAASGEPARSASASGSTDACSSRTSTMRSRTLRRRSSPSSLTPRCSRCARTSSTCALRPHHSVAFPARAVLGVARRPDVRDGPVRNGSHAARAEADMAAVPVNRALGARPVCLLTAVCGVR